MNTSLNKRLYRSSVFSFALAFVVTSISCFAQDKSVSTSTNSENAVNVGTSQNLQVAPAPQNDDKIKCRPLEETKNLPPSSERKKSQLGDAAFARNLSAVKKLLKQKVDPNEKDFYENTPLIMALSIRVLESKTMPPGIDSSIERDNLKTKRFQPLIVKELLENKADPNIKGYLGKTPIITTVFGGDDPLKLLALLIKYKADVDAQDDKNFTALMHAVSRNKPEIVKFLLKNGARRDLTGCLGETALSIAQENNDAKMISLLQ